MTQSDSASLSRLAFTSIVTGLSVGVVGSLFRGLLNLANQARDAMIETAHATPWQGFLTVAVVVAVAAMLARWLVARFAPVAAGSGVQHVEAVMRNHSRPAGARVIPVKFVGGVLAIGSGLALGREGPTVQMGAAIGEIVSKRMMPGDPDRTIVDAAGAGAGLAVAFNAPMGGSVFVFEELTHSFRTRQVVATLGAAAIAIAVMRLALGNLPEFAAGSPVDQPIAELPHHFAMGAMLGIIGAAYSALTIAFLDAGEALRKVPSVLRAGFVGLVVGMVGCFSPSLIGGGETLASTILASNPAASALTMALIVRLLIGPFSYAAATPGGLFAPLLAMGAAFGSLFALVVQQLLPVMNFSPVAFAVVGMAAMFAAVVRAPLTGGILTIEMTGRADCALAILVACFAATTLASMMGSEPIYDTLRKRMLAAEERDSSGGRDEAFGSAPRTSKN
jgi:CIC family chloride channel protein